VCLKYGIIVDMERPKLSDPQEYALIKKIYFESDAPLDDDIDSIEKLERGDSRIKNNINNAR